MVHGTNSLKKKKKGLKIYNAICSLVFRRGFLFRCAILVYRFLEVDPIYRCVQDAKLNAYIH